MMRQKVSTPKKSKSTFRAKTVSDIIAPEPDFNLEVAKIAPSVTPSQLQECNIGRNLDFSVLRRAISCPVLPVQEPKKDI